MLYWYEGHKKEAGRQDLESPKNIIREQRHENQRWVTWGYDEFIDRQTEHPLVTGETRNGFFYAELTASPNMGIQDFRTIFLQYEAESQTFDSPRAGGSAFAGAIS